MPIDLNDFIAFIDSQPPEKDIDHWNETIEPEGELLSAWCGCAVGEYVSDRTGQPQNKLEVDNEDIAELVDLLNDDATRVFNALNVNQPATYGELQQLLDPYRPDGDA